MNKEREKNKKPRVFVINLLDFMLINDILKEVLKEKGLVNFPPSVAKSHDLVLYREGKSLRVYLD